MPPTNQMSLDLPYGINIDQGFLRVTLPGSNSKAGKRNCKCRHIMSPSQNTRFQSVHQSSVLIIRSCNAKSPAVIQILQISKGN
ncbi:hypothetical protein LIER_19678 [Lithospermum erythrorhizon]|uniref:Uncharacterized protein n=1 Tax=Lithospermum erythrorhizon TaxID=34254 RepID=A0AAV3QII5_LITER